MLPILPLLACCAPAQDPPLASQGDPPALVVLVVCDQLIPEQLDRLSPWLDGGLARFWNKGRAYPKASLEYALTETGPGHATLSTGSLPSRHGIVGNLFFERSLGKRIYCVGDSSSYALTTDGVVPSRAGSSAHRLKALTLAETLLRSDPESRVFAVSMKDRSAILLSGPTPAWAVWWDRTSGGFMSSTHYGTELPAFVDQWNRTWTNRAAAWEWTPSFDSDPSPLGTAEDNRDGESPYGEQGIHFPYRLPGYNQAIADGDDRQAAAAQTKALASALYGYPLGDQFTLEVAARALVALDLGQDEHPDLLAVSLSSCDAVGHSFGPYSWEVTDTLLRTDKTLGQFLDLLDQGVGRGRWVAVLTSDHGVLELPEALQARGVGAKRIRIPEMGVFRGQVTRALEDVHGLRFKLGFDGRGLSFDPLEVAASGIDPAFLRRTLAEACTKAHWVAEAYTLEELTSSDPAKSIGEDPWLDLYRASSFPGRNLDVVLRPDPWVLMSSGRGTSHGSPYPYDRRIPLAFLGAPFPQGRSYERAGSRDVLPTLLPLLGLKPLEPIDGRDLRESPKARSESPPADRQEASDSD